MQDSNSSRRIVDHTNPDYIRLWKQAGENRFNGAYYYSKEIVKNIIPNVKTDRKWITIHTPKEPADHSIVFVHNNKMPEYMYSYLRMYDDVVLVCGVPQTVEKVINFGKAIYLPLSIDTEELKKYRSPKTRDCAYFGRYSKTVGLKLPPKCEFICNRPRHELLKEMAKYRTVYAVGRTAIEARFLGCKIGVYDPRFPDPSIWKVLSNQDAAKILQRKLDEIDN